MGFDDAASINGVYGDKSGTLPGDSAIPTLDTSVKASGNSALKFTIPSNSGSNSSGAFFTNFSDDLSTQFGENQEFYIQWRQRFSPELLNTKYLGSAGWKQVILGTGDKPQKPYASCTALEVVTQNADLRGFAHMYNSCTGSTSHGPYDGFYEPFAGYDFKLQNARPSPYCTYLQGNTTPPSYFPPTGNCFGYFANEWMTFQIKIKTGPRVNDEFTNSFVSLWIAREGAASELVINWGPYKLSAGSAGEDQKFGKVWLLPYQTDKNPSQATPTAYTWYDELIISRNKIADPGAAAPATSSAPPASPASPAPSAADSSAPTVPSGLRSTAAASQVSLAWSASTDNVAVTGYRILRNGTQVGTTSTTSFVDAGLPANTTFTYNVAATDAAENVSAQSAAVSATTPASAPTGSQPTLAQLAASLQPGSWAELRTTGFSGGFLETKSAGKSILQYAEKAVWDPTTRRFLFMGAPHYEPHKFIIYSDATNSWSTGPLANPCQATDTGCVSHSYDHNTINPATGEMYHRLVGSNQVYRLAPGAGAWSKLPDIPMSSAQCCGALAWFPERNELVFFDGDWGIWAYSPSTNNWKQLARTNGDSGAGGNLPKLPMAAYSNIAHYNPLQNAILFGGTSGSTNYLYKYSSNGTFTRLKDAPITIGIFGSNGSVVTVDPVSGKYLVFGEGNRFYEYDLGADAWTEKSSSIAPPIWLNGSVFDTVVAPISTYGVMMFIKYNFDQSKIFLYKHQ